MTRVYPSRINDQYDIKFTNEQGAVDFEKLAQWRIESLMIHGMEFYDWSLCLTKDGYVTQENIEVKKKEKIKIILKQGNTPPKQYAYQC